MHIFKYTYCLEGQFSHRTEADKQLKIKEKF